MCLCLVSQSCLTLCDPTVCSPLGSSVHGILQSRILEWVAIHFSRGSSQPREWTQVSLIAGRFFTVWVTREILITIYLVYMWIPYHRAAPGLPHLLLWSQEHKWAPKSAHLHSLFCPSWRNLAHLYNLFWNCEFNSSMPSTLYHRAIENISQTLLYSEIISVGKTRIQCFLQLSNWNQW